MWLGCKMYIGVVLGICKRRNFYCMYQVSVPLKLLNAVIAVYFMAVMDNYNEAIHSNYSSVFVLQNKRWLGRVFALDPCLSKLQVSLFPISPVRSHQFALSKDSLKVVPPKDGYQMPVFPRLNSRFGFLGSCSTSDRALEPTLRQASRHGKQSRRCLLWIQ